MEYHFNSFSEDPLNLKHIEVNNLILYQPRNAVRVKIRQEAEDHLRKTYKEGTYTNTEECVNILNHLFEFYSDKLDQLVPKLFCKDWLAFTLFQYEQSGKIASAYKGLDLSKADYVFWRDNGPLFRQTSDFLAEKFIEYSTDIENNSLNQYENLSMFDEAWICAKQSIQYSHTSNVTFMLQPNNTWVKILAKGEEIFLEHSTSDEFHNCVQKQYEISNLDITRRKEFLKEYSFEHNLEHHIKVLDEPFKSHLGLSYSDIRQILFSIRYATRPITSPAKIPMVDLDDYLDQIVESGQFDKQSVQGFLDSLTLSKSKLLKDPRKIWNYKQRNRISKKPFLQIVKRGKATLMWSDSKLSDYLIHLDLEITFKNLPNEWRTKAIDQALDQLSNKAGKWFEKLASENIQTLGLKGSSAKKKITSNNNQILIPSRIGEIDFIGISEADQAIVLLEFKMINTGFEPKTFRDEKSKFIDNDDSYIKKFIKKINWVLDNKEELEEILTKKYDYIEPLNDHILCSFVTHYVTIIPCFYSDIPCKTLPEFLNDFRDNGIWPYKSGIVRSKVPGEEI